MDNSEKEIYSLIFTLALKISKDKKFSKFAHNMIDTVVDFECRNDDTFTYSWNLLKEYADLTTKQDSEEQWKALVDSADNYAREHNDKLTRRMIWCVLDELERRSKHDNR